MHNQITTLLSSEKHHVAIADALTSHFGQSFAVWKAVNDDFEQIVGEECDFPSQSAALLAELDDATTGYSITSTGDGAALLSLAWSTHCENWLAVSQLECHDESFLRRLVESWFREQRSEEEITELNALSRQLTRQVARGFEELSFTRHLATALTSCDASQDMSCLAEMILPDLRRTVRANCVALVERDEGGLNQEYRVSCRVGGIETSDQSLLNVVRRFGPSSLFEPFVHNESSGCELNFTRGAVVVCVRKGDEVAGWLVALDPVDRSRPTFDSVQSEQEFGSFETLMMETAASFLSSQARNAALVEELEHLVKSVVGVLVATIEAKDPYTRGHSERVAEYARLICIEMGFSQEEASRIHFTGLLHDIGKIGIPDAILRKKGKLTEEEFEAIKAHPRVGWEIVKDIESLAYVKAGVLHHHERFDGGGYPDGLAGLEIPLIGRIMAVADSFDAMTSDRSYRQGMTVAKVLEILADGAGSQWDPDVIEATNRVLPQIIAVADLK
jgi:HD-GYP domain-containing protein (c-di-GMP phosphodiesterase class II)